MALVKRHNKRGDITWYIRYRYRKTRTPREARVSGVNYFLVWRCEEPGGGTNANHSTYNNCF